MVAWSDARREELVRFVESLPWGDLGPAIGDIETGLRRAFDATASWLPLWDEMEERYGDEFYVSPADVDALSPDERLAYVARLVFTVAVMHGIASTLFPRHRSDGPARNTVAMLLRRLEELSTPGPTRAGATCRHEIHEGGEVGMRFRAIHDPAIRRAAAAWDGDIDELRPLTEALLSNSELADVTFLSRQEAFAAGLRLSGDDQVRCSHDSPCHQD